MNKNFLCTADDGGWANDGGNSVTNNTRAGVFRSGSDCRRHGGFRDP